MAKRFIPAFLCSLLAAGGCLKSETVKCSFGVVCPREMVCDNFLDDDGDGATDCDDPDCEANPVCP